MEAKRRVQRPEAAAGMDTLKLKVGVRNHQELLKMELGRRRITRPLVEWRVRGVVMLILTATLTSTLSLVCSGKALMSKEVEHLVSPASSKIMPAAAVPAARVELRLKEFPSRMFQESTPK